MSLTVRRRGKKAPREEVEVEVEKTFAPLPSSLPQSHFVALIAVTVVAAFLRFRKLGTPDKVVFDEVHFGKFASYYLEGTYFFDLHPPFAKLLIALAGYIVGYDGKFKFDTIGESYTANNVPYVAYRLLVAIQGTLVVPVMYLTMQTLGFTVGASVLAALLVLFDNAQIIDSRLILLDATLILSVAVTMLCYAKFSTFRKKPFSKQWWTWLFATGAGLLCVISTKYVGVFTYFTIGLAVLHELWILLDVERGLSIEQFAQHFAARLFALIVVPFCLYLFWFYLHFALLTRSGPGDAFMSAEFQETLLESPLARELKQVNYFDIITLKHKDTETFLHSNHLKYPLRYENGRISSNLQMVTAVESAQDSMSHWELVPTSEQQKGEGVYTNDVVRFRHIGTGGFLLTHDVASPLLSTNEEFVVVHGDAAQQRYNETLFRLRFAEPGSSLNKRKLVKSKATNLRIVHVDTVVAMWTHDDELLPEWGLEEQEVSGNKKVQDKDNTWVVDAIVNMPADDVRNEYVPKEVKKLPFLKKWLELQGLMFVHNNQLSSEHPFASQPDSWPLAWSGVSFWNDNDARRQIFFIGNVVGFWIQVAFLMLYVLFVFVDQVTRRRRVHLFNERARLRLYNTLGFLFVGWAAHYLPFFLMNRQKFLHHYLPAHLLAALYTGGFMEFVCTNRGLVARRGLAPNGIDWAKFYSGIAVIIVAVAWFLYFTKAITYGNETLDPEEIKKRQWLGIVLHYAK